MLDNNSSRVHGAELLKHTEIALIIASYSLYVLIGGRTVSTGR